MKVFRGNVKLVIVYVIIFSLLIPAQMGNAYQISNNENTTETALYNGGFEESIVDGEIPGWSVLKGNPLVSAEKSSKGEHSIHIKNSSNETSSGVHIESDPIAVNSQASYLISVDVLPVMGNLNGIYVYVYDNQGNRIPGKTEHSFYEHVSVQSSNMIHDRWNKIDVLVETPENASSLNVAVITGRGTYEYYLDEFAVTSLEDSGTGASIEYLFQDSFSGEESIRVLGDITQPPITSEQTFGANIYATRLGMSRSFEFDVEKSGLYLISFQGQLQVPSAIADILIDGKRIGNVDFYGQTSMDGPDLPIKTVALSEGTHVRNYIYGYWPKPECSARCQSFNETNQINTNPTRKFTNIGVRGGSSQNSIISE